MKVVGLDLSLASTGIADVLGSYTLRPGTKGVERLIQIRDAVLTSVVLADLVVIEGYSFGSRFQLPQMGELGGIVRVVLWEVGVPFAIVQPATLKRYATGKGSAPKEAMLSAAVRRSGVEYRSSDEADAAWLRWMGLDHLDEPAFPMPALNRTALDKVDWPEVVLA